MPMFDDPKKELKRLENELLAEEYEDDPEETDDLSEDYGETDLDEFFEEEAEEDDAYSRPLEKQILGDDYSRSMSEILLEEEDDQPVRKKKKKGGSVVGLAILCVLETAAIVGLLAWWYLCLR